MALYDEHPLAELDRKILQTYGDQVVVKSLARNASFQRVPRYVAEYLIAKYVKPETWQADLASVQTKLRDLLPDVNQREWLKEKLLRTGEITVVDAVEGRVDLRGGARWAKVAAVQDDKVRFSAQIAEQHPGILLGGMWGTAKLKYAPELHPDNPIELLNFIPFQVGPPKLDEWVASRKSFTTDEWISLLLQSAGYAPTAFPTRRQKLLLLTRLIPLVERNVNMIELGPRQTGKTFLLRNLSARVFTVSGGRTTPANLFVNLSTNALGILGTRKVVMFDEIAHTTFDDDTTLSTLKDFMESGQFSRGAKSFASDASLVLAGNLDVDGDRPHPRYRHLLEPLPKELVDSALVDRIHGFLPGWEIPKISTDALTNGVGFVTDYFGEVLASLREFDFHDWVGAVDLSPGLTRRDHVAVLRLAGGLGKMLYPDRNATPEERLEVVQLACEFRQRIHNQLAAIAPGEFKPKPISAGGAAGHSAPDVASKPPEIPKDDRLNNENLVGVTTALAVVERGGQNMGGDLFAVQFSAFKGKAGVELTGLHGKVLRDSVTTAYNIVRSRGRDFGVSDGDLKDRSIAVHLTRISELRDGPSAGLAFVVGMVSALTGRAVKAGSAMTGEVSLHGEVTGVGGIAEKVVAAAKAGRTMVVLPAENASEVKSLPSDVLAKVRIVPVRTVAEALAEILVSTDQPATPAAPSEPADAPAI